MAEAEREPCAIEDPRSTAAGSGRVLILSAAIVLGSVIYGWATIPFWFDMNDDAAMLGISAGLFGEGVGDPRLVYQSAFLGAPIGVLFRIWPGFDWYSGLQFAVCLVGFWSMGHVLLRRDASLFGIASVAAATSIFLPPLLFNLQFTQTAFVCLMAGLVLLIDAMRRRPVRWPRLAAALAWMVLAILFRAANLVACQVLLISIGALMILDRMRDQDRAGVLRDVSILAAIGVGLGVIGAGLHALEAAIFYADPAWSAYWTHLADRPYVLENWPRWVGLERIVAALDRELGITPEQYFAMASWFPISQELYSVERFREMVGVIEGIEFDGDSLRAAFWSNLDAGRRFVVSTPLFRYSLGLIGLFSALAAVRDPSVRGRSLLLGAAWMAIPCLFWLAIGLAYRPPPPRVWLPIVALSLWCSLACHAVSGPARSMPTIAGCFSDRRGLVTLLILGLALAGPVPVHAELRRITNVISSHRAQACAETKRQVAAFEQLPAGAKIYLAPLVVHADCYLRPFHMDYPQVLVDHAFVFGWRNLTPGMREKLFAEESDLFDAICKSPTNMLVVQPQTFPILTRYLDRHKPGVSLSRYANDLPANILSCRHRASRKVPR